jgi:hypothetical protein
VADEVFVALPATFRLRETLATNSSWEVVAFLSTVEYTFFFSSDDALRTNSDRGVDRTVTVLDLKNAMA